jgi:DNA-binding MarR family transcriptional regulator
MEQVKEAFSKVKQDIDSLKKEVFLLSKDLIEMRRSLVEICDILKELSKGKEEEGKGFPKEGTPAPSLQKQTPQPPIPTHNSLQTLQTLQNTQNLTISTGNQGVPTDRQTDRQTDQQTHKGSYNNTFLPKEDSISNAVQMIESLDNLKKEIRLKFKRLTEQELLVFSTIYQASEEKGYTDYKTLSEKLNLTESSIRDYIGRLIKKGIPVEKVKINNKTIHLFISQNLKKVASLSTILQLRDL